MIIRGSPSRATHPAGPRPTAKTIIIPDEQAVSAQRLLLCDGPWVPDAPPGFGRICQPSARLLASAAMAQPVDLKLLLKHLRGKLPSMLETLEKFVCCESPSTEKPAADRCAALIADAWKSAGVQVEVLAQKH